MQPVVAATPVMLVQQPMMVVQQNAPSDYQIGLCSCFNDFPICLCGTFCALCLAANVKAELDDRACDCCDFLCYPHPYFNRQQLRSKFGYARSACTDCCLSWLCMCCFNIQDANEIKARKPAMGLKVHNSIFN